MSKKAVGSICGIIAIISCATCSVCYAVGNSSFPWWLIVMAGGIACAIVSQIGVISRTKDKDQKHKKVLGCICSSISMVSVFVFLIVEMLTNINDSWIIVFIGGVISGIIYMIDNVRKEK